MAAHARNIRDAELQDYIIIIIVTIIVIITIIVTALAVLVSYNWGPITNLNGVTKCIQGCD